MANITGVNPPPLDDQEYVDKITTSFNSIDNHDHTPGKGLPIGTGSLANGAVTDVKVAANAAIQRSKLATGSNASVVINNSSGVMTDVGTMANGEVVIGASGGVPVKATISGTANQVIVSNGAGSITLSTPQAIGTTSNVQFGTALIGTGSIEATAAFQVNSINKGIIPPRMTASERDAIPIPAAGLIVYNTTANQLNIFNGTSWGAVGGGLTVGTFTGTTVTATNDPTQSWRYTGTSEQTFTSFNITSMPDGGRITIIGTSDTNTITIPPDVAGVVYQNGTKILGLGESVTYEHVLSLSGLVEVK
jgi:hypothetical protein